MMDQPSIAELVEAVREFLETRAMPELKGHTAFHARVAANALGIVARQLQLGEKASAEEKTRLVALLGREGTLEELKRENCTQLRARTVRMETPGLAEHLAKTTRDKVSIDQPNYSGLKRAEP